MNILNRTHSLIVFMFAVSATTISCICMKGENTEPLATARVAGEKYVQDTCQTDDDCTLVDADCCGCRQGGKQKAISKKTLKAFLENQLEECTGQVCIQMISKDPSCKSVEASCVQNKCVISN